MRPKDIKTWNIVPDDIDEFTNLHEFKRKIKLCEPEGYTCRMCKVLIEKVGFIY